MAKRLVVAISKDRRWYWSDWRPSALGVASGLLQSLREHDMLPEQSTVTFTVGERHQTAIRLVRRAFAQQGLRVAAELDVTTSIKQELGASLAPCVVLYVDDASLLLEAVVFNRGAPLLIPQPVVISGKDRQTEVLLHRLEALVDAGSPVSLREPLLKLHERILRALETIAEREGAHVIHTS